MEVQDIHSKQVIRRPGLELSVEQAPYKHLFVETAFYKNSKNAHWYVLIFFVFIFFMFYGLLVFDDYVFPLIVLVLLFAVPIFSVLSKRGWFSFAAIDPRKLIIDITGIQVGDEYFEFANMDRLNCYFHSFYQLRIEEQEGVVIFSGRKPNRYEEGNKNEMEFVYANKKYYLKFILRNKQAYLALRTIMQYWITANDHFTAKEKYPLQIIDLWNP